MYEFHLNFSYKLMNWSPLKSTVEMEADLNDGFFILLNTKKFFKWFRNSWIHSSYSVVVFCYFGQWKTSYLKIHNIYLIFHMRNLGYVHIKSSELLLTLQFPFFINYTFHSYNVMCIIWFVWIEIGRRITLSSVRLYEIMNLLILYS